jgi:transcriptional antiterminator RfaH
VKWWFLVHTHARAENKALMHLEHQGFGAYLPLYLAQRYHAHARRRERVAKPLFPSYLFVHLHLGQDRWRAVYSTFGVQTLVSAADGPLSVAEEIIEEIRAREDDRGYVVLGGGCTYREGDRVRITEGPFVAVSGLIESQSGAERVTVLLDLLGRQVKADVPLRAVMLCA